MPEIWTQKQWTQQLWMLLRLCMWIRSMWGILVLWVLVMRLLRGRAILPPLWAPPVIPKWMWLLKNLHQETNTSAATAQNMPGRVPSQLIPQKSLQPAHSQPVSSPPHQPSHTAQSAGQALSCPFQPHPLTWSRRRRRRGRRRSQ